MADVSIEIDFDGDRGQLLLIAALAVAVILVGVALLLNAAIFTENVATRETGADGREATNIRAATAADIGELIERENKRDGAAAAGHVSDGIDAMSPLLAREHVRHGTVVELERHGIDEGERIEWNTEVNSEDFTVERGSENETVRDWTLLSDVSGVRAFKLTADTEPLSSMSEPNASQLKNETTGAFGIEFTGTNVIQYVYEDDGDVVVAQVSGGSVDHRCSIAGADEVTVDLTGDRLETDIETTHCYRGLWPTPDSSEISTIEIRNGDRAGGTFSLTIDDASAATSESELTTEPAVYAATAELRYTSTKLDFETQLVVAPGSPQ